MDYRLIKRNNSPNHYIEWLENGVQKRVSTGQRDYKKARAILTNFIQQRKQESGPDHTIGYILDWYFETHAAKLPSADTARHNIQKLQDFYNPLHPDAINPELQDLFVKTRRGEGVGDETISRELSVLSAALRRAHERLGTNPPPKIKLLPKAAPRERWLTRNEVAALLRSFRATKRARHLIIFTQLALYSGQRPNEILSLTWDRVDLDTGIIDYIDPHKPRTNKRAATVGANEYIKGVLRRAKRKARSDHVIEESGQPIKSVKRGFARHALKLGLTGVSPYTLRHTFATWAMRNSHRSQITLFDLMPVMGHSSIKTTQRYAKHAPEAHKRVLGAARKK